ncbi:MAG TPA: glyoxylate/hydroxypyruvate reductase A [Xanthobacteraceae bacterium]|nr:glyoxylate/hydroxypyruvate reductase A [Xanthobacteraceae bacterium]
MPTILLAIEGWEPEGWLARFRAEANGREVRLAPDIGDPAAIDYACVWKQPAGLLATFPNLQAVFSLGAGVDHLLSDPKLPLVPIVRIVDPDLTGRMTGYVVLHALLHQRKMKFYTAQQRERVWRDLYERPAEDVRVGIMGMGVLGTAAGTALHALGFKVAGWSRSPKRIAGIETFAGEAEKNAFLGRSDILVCLLPLTGATRGILRYDLCKRLARDAALGGPVLINAGRGGLQVEADILRALDDGTLAGASLDVFETEPLPAASPLWNHPKVYVTPHNAASSDPRALVKNVIAQIERFERGLPLEHVVDRTLGY